MTNPHNRRFAVAVSFPGEHRRFVRNVVARLAEAFGKDRVFFDEWYETELLGQDGDLKLRQYYREESELVVPFFSEHYRKPWCGVEWNAIRGMLLQRGDEDAVVPVEMDGTRIEGWESIDFALRRKKRSGREIADLIIEAYRVRHPEAEISVEAASTPRPAGRIRRGPATPPLAFRRSRGRIGRHAPEQLFGREAGLKRLDEAWNDPAQHVVVIQAWGGTGKTALVAAWMAEREQAGWPGTARVFDWSFYSQGTRGDGQRAVSADVFIAEALEFFGDKDPQADSPHDRGARLAQLIADQPGPCLVVLDGVEPLQHPPGPLAGRLTDPAVEALLSGLATRNTGLCVVTTRESLTDLVGRPTVGAWSLEHLDESAGAAVLHAAGATRAGDAPIDPDDAELRAACREVSGHALTLTLMGKYLALADETGRGGDIRQRDTFALAEADPEWVTTYDANSPYGHAFKVIAAYERWFLDERAERTPDERLQGRIGLSILRVLGLFDRPASPDCLVALRREPVIEGITDDLTNLLPLDWIKAVNRLAAHGLVSWAGVPELGLQGTSGEPPATPSSDENLGAHSARPQPPSEPALDAHPLVREYFARRLRKEVPDSFLAAHGRLFDHLCEVTEHRPDTLPGLQPLYQAVTHGCLAGRQQEACDKVLYDRIWRRDFFSRNQLGSIGAELVAVAAFFEVPWRRLSPNLSQADQLWLLNEVAFVLRALGRLTEAREPVRASMEINAKAGEWENAAAVAGNLSGLEVTLGSLLQAVEAGGRAIEWADRSGEAFGKMVNRTTAADALHQRGDRDEALALFREAERIQAEDQPQFPLLYSLWGFRYADLILATAERAVWRVLLAGREDANVFCFPLSDEDRSRALAQCAEAARRATQTIEWSRSDQSASLLDIPLDQLTLARAAVYRAVLVGCDSAATHSTSSTETTEPSPTANTALAAAIGTGSQPTKLRKAATKLNHALTGLRRANIAVFLPQALLTAALLEKLRGKAVRAKSLAHLRETQQIAERGPMPLYLADVHLHRARLFRDRAELAKARQLIEKHHYGRRRDELEDAERVLAAEPDSHSPD